MIIHDNIIWYYNILYVHMYNIVQYCKILYIYVHDFFARACQGWKIGSVCWRSATSLELPFWKFLPMGIALHGASMLCTVASKRKTLKPRKPRRRSTSFDRWSAVLGRFASMNLCGKCSSKRFVQIWYGNTMRKMCQKHPRRKATTRTLTKACQAACWMRN